MGFRTLVFAAAVISISGLQMRSQLSGSCASSSVATKEDPAKDVDGLLSMMEFEVVGAAKAMPADKYGFLPAPGIFAAGETTQFTRKWRTQRQGAAIKVAIFRRNSWRMPESASTPTSSAQPHPLRSFPT